MGPSPKENAGSSLTSGSYTIKPLDLLRVALYVADEIQFESQVRVSQDGSVSLPHLGRVNLADKSLDEARDYLYQPYDERYYVDPYVDLVVLEYSDRKVTVIGKVNRQGSIPFPSEEDLYLLEAIAMAGGWSSDRLADTKNVTITRTDEDGKKFVIEVDARNITATEHPLKDGDLVNVPERIW